MSIFRIFYQSFINVSKGEVDGDRDKEGDGDDKWIAETEMTIVLNKIISNYMREITNTCTYDVGHEDDDDVQQ